MRLFQMLVDAIGEQEHARRTRYGGINREEDFFDLHVVRIVAEMAKLIRRVKGKFVLTGTFLRRPLHTGIPDAVR